MSYISKIKLPNQATTYYLKDGDVRVAIGVTNYREGQAYNIDDYVLYGEVDGVKALYRITANITAANNSNWSKVSKESVSVISEIQDINSQLDSALPLISGDNITITQETNGVKIGVTTTTPIAHADETIKYGVGTSSLYGHVKLVSGDLKDKTATDGMAASQSHTHSQYLTSSSTLDPTKLDTSKKVPTACLPDSIVGQVLYGGTVNGSNVATLSTNAKTKLGTTSNTITLTNDTTNITGYKANEGIYYIMSADSNFASLGLKTGDWLLSTGASWTKIDNTDAVTSVNNKTGAVTISATTTKISAAASGGSVTLNNGTAITYGTANVGTAVNVGTSLTGTTSFNTDAIKTATCSQSFTTTGISMALDTTDTEMLVFSNVTPTAVSISTTAATKSSVSLGTSSITPAVASTTTFTPKTSATLTNPSITISNGTTGDVTVAIGLSSSGN